MNRPASEKLLGWTAIDLWIHKNHDDDIFRELEKMKEEEEEDGDLESHIKWTHSAYRICGQLVAYTSALHRSQFRIFSFSIILFGGTGRLLRWDRSGAIYTEPFNWAADHDTLFEFIWRFNFLSDVDRGFDTTVTSVDDDEAEAALSKLRTYKSLENVVRTDLYKLLVHDDIATDEPPRSYITPSAIWATDALFGRSTFGYIAYDVANTNLVYLKDFWRTDHPGIQKEGDVYRALHNAQVPNIARLGRASDVPLSPQRANTLPLDVQRTKTQDYVKGGVLGHEWCPGQPRVDPYVHYRLVLETLGQPLNTFKSTRQLCEVIRDAIVGKGFHCLPFFSGLNVRDSSYGGVREGPNFTSGCECGEHLD
jgi:Fungal protein kinase